MQEAGVVRRRNRLIWAGLGWLLGVGGAAAQPTIESCLATLRVNAPANGVSVADFDRYTRHAQLLESTVSAARAQAGKQEPWWSYIAKTVDDERIREGKAILQAYGDDLAHISAQYRVDPAALVAIFGIETNYGKQLGKTSVLDAWLTRACTEKKPLWVHNAYASIRLLRDGTVPEDGFVGSWSGAFGMTQFIPTSFYELARDGDEDGRIDLYQSLPDALASTANHLRKRGIQWAHNLPAVIEVTLPPALASRIPASPEAEYVGTQDRRSLAQWVAQGVQRADGAALSGDNQGYLFAPTGRRGPVFLATRNFDAILHYNQSRRYALSVALLVQGLQDGTRLLTPWPTDNPGLSRAEIRQLQTILSERGHDIGVVDGIPGARTMDALQQERARQGLAPVDFLGEKVLRELGSGS